MRGPGTAVAIALLFAALAAAGCGLGPGKGRRRRRADGDAGLRDRAGASPSLGDVTESDTVMRALERSADDHHPLRRRLRAVDRGCGSATRARRLARLVLLRQRGRGDRRRRRLPAARGRVGLVGLPRLGRGDAGAGRGRLLAAAVRRRLRRQAAPGGGRVPGRRGGLRHGARAAGGAPGVAVAGGIAGGAIRVLVGPWARVREDPAAAQIEDGPQASGVFADFEPAGERLRAAGAGRRRRAGTRASAPAPAWSPRRGATKSRPSGSSPGPARPGSSAAGCSTRPTCATITRLRSRGGRRRRFRCR